MTDVRPEAVFIEEGTKAAIKETVLAPFMLKRQIVESGSYTYIGYAAAGSTTSSAVWMIVRIDASGNQLHADGNTNFDNIFDNAATTVVYS